MREECSDLEYEIVSGDPSLETERRCRKLRRTLAGSQATYVEDSSPRARRRETGGS
ncbi:hypothetical protein ACWGI0_07510 [Streptomyces sp. NPDC054802]